MTATVRTWLRATFLQQHDGLDHASPAQIRLTWHTRTPHVVEGLFFGVPWEIGWELLNDGLDRPTGIGDIFVAPHPDGRHHELVFDNGQARCALQVRTGDFTAFVDDVRLVLDDYATRTPYRRPAPPPPAGGTA